MNVTVAGVVLALIVLFLVLDFAFAVLMGKGIKKAERFDLDEPLRPKSIFERMKDHAENCDLCWVDGRPHLSKHCEEGLKLTRECQSIFRMKKA